MRRLLLIVLLVCFLLGMATREEAENAVEESATTSVENEDNVKYIPKVIIEAKWGDGPGEFGFEPDPDVPPAGIGPCGLTVDDAKLYILDAVNRRISLYSTNGSFLKSITLEENKFNKRLINPGFNALKKDSKGNFYILGYEKGGSKILKFDSTGNFVKEVFKSPFDENGKVRIPVDPRIKINGDSLIASLSWGNTEGVTNLFYIHKETGRAIKEVKVSLSTFEKSFQLEYPEDIKEIRNLKKEMKDFVLWARRSSQVLGANAYDQNGNFYELLWDPCKYNDKGVKIIKWEKIL